MNNRIRRSMRLARQRARALPAGSVERLARELMAYSMAVASKAEVVRPVIVVDPYDAVHCFNNVVGLESEVLSVEVCVWGLVSGVC